MEEQRHIGRKEEDKWKRKGRSEKVRDNERTYKEMISVSMCWNIKKR